MSESTLQSTGSPGRRWQWLRAILLLLGIAAMPFVIERWRGQWALNHWKREMAARGEVFDARQLWPPASAKAVEFTNELNRLVGVSWSGVDPFVGQISAIVADEPDGWRRGSDEPAPRRWSGESLTNSWQTLDQSFRENEARLNALRALMRHPSAAPAYDVEKVLGSDRFPSFPQKRRGAQIFQAATMNDLHRGDLAAATQDLEGLLAFVKLDQEDPTLVSYMVHIAILGISVDASWDALQADGWTEPQLAAFQQTCLNTQRLLAGMARTLEAMRIGRLHAYESFRSHSYDWWIARYKPTYEGFGARPLASETEGWGRVSRQWLFHPVWSFAWADQQALNEARFYQRAIDLGREATRRQSWRHWKEQAALLEKDAYSPPPGAWRFYRQLPILDTWADAVSGKPVKPSANDPWPYPNFDRAWAVTFKHLTLHEMVITAIALKRYELEHGTPPVQLKELVPDFLPRVPVDFMDGQPLRYRRNADDSFTLYSIGNDLEDDGGRLQVKAARSKNDSPWYANDWVWPRASRAKRPQVAENQ